MYSKLCNSKFAPKIVSFAPISVVDVVVSGHKTYASMWTCVFPALTTANVNAAKITDLCLQQIAKAKQTLKDKNKQTNPQQSLPLSFVTSLGGCTGRHPWWHPRHGDGRKRWELLGGASQRHGRHQEPSGQIQWPALRGPQWKRYADISTQIQKQWQCECRLVRAGVWNCKQLSTSTQTQARII